MHRQYNERQWSQIILLHHPVVTSLLRPSCVCTLLWPRFSAAAGLETTAASHNARESWNKWFMLECNLVIGIHKGFQLLHFHLPAPLWYLVQVLLRTRLLLFQCWLGEWRLIKGGQQSDLLESRPRLESGNSHWSDTLYSLIFRTSLL